MRAFSLSYDSMAEVPFWLGGVRVEEKKEQLEIEKTGESVVETLRTEDIRNMVYVVRGKQVMLDSDLAKLYGVEAFSFGFSLSTRKRRI